MSDGEWHPVTGKLKDSNVIIPWSAERDATMLSYAECGYQTLNLQNEAGFPAWPGRVEIVNDH